MIAVLFLFQLKSTLRITPFILFIKVLSVEFIREDLESVEDVKVEISGKKSTNFISFKTSIQTRNI
jgi:hypothetical protein